MIAFGGRCPHGEFRGYCGECRGMPPCTHGDWPMFCPPCLAEFAQRPLREAYERGYQDAKAGKECKP